MISIIVPTYNKASILNTTIHELLKQTHNDIEIIIVNDGSSDNSDETIKNIKSNKIKYIQHEQRLGTTVARISGIKECKGEFIAFLDDDDVWNYNKLYLKFLLIVNVWSRRTSCNLFMLFCRFLYR